MNITLKAFVLFIDLKKAYDSVLRAAMSLVLAKYGVPDVMISVIKSLHDNMHAGISVDGNLAIIEVSNGLRQGCVLAPTLFILFFNVVIWCWQQRCAQLGVKFLYKCGGKLVGERTRAPSTSWMTELSFADDAAIVTYSREDLVKATTELNIVVTACGLTISIPKTKFLVAGSGTVQGDLDKYLKMSAFLELSEDLFLVMQ